MGRKRPWVLEIAGGSLGQPTWAQWGRYSTYDRAREESQDIVGRTRIIHVGNIHDPKKQKEAPSCLGTQKT